jgi:CheY-like chemotaxis protein
MVSTREPPVRFTQGAGSVPTAGPWPAITSDQCFKTGRGAHMEPAFFNGMPSDVLIVEDDPIIAIDFEDTILGFGVKTVRTATSVARALQIIAYRKPDFALLDVVLARENTFALAEKLDALQIPYVFVTGYGADVQLPVALADKPRLVKPCSSEALEAALRRRV